MRINLLDFVPKYIKKREIIIGLPGKKLPIGRKISNFNGKIIEVKVKDIKDSENPKFKILNNLSLRDMSFEELSKETKLSYENLRWYITRRKDSLLKSGSVKIKEKVFCPHKNTNGGVMKIIFSITKKGRKRMQKIKQIINLPKRKELVLINSKDKEFVLSSWWTSWLKPLRENLEYNKSQQRFIYKIPKNQILIQYEKLKNALYSTILPKEININNEKFITSLGLLLGEMRVREGEISFSNTEPQLADYVLDSLKYFGLTKDNFNFRIQINTKTSKVKYKELIDYWAKELNIDKKSISNIFEYKDYGTKRTKFGRIDFIYFNIVFKEIMNNLINFFLVNSKNNKDHAIYMLRGLLAAEGYVSASTSSKALDRVAISSCSDYNKKQIVNLLSILDIRSSIRNNCVAITSKDNFNKIIQYNLLKISKDKKKFKRLYNKFKYNKPKLIPL